MGTINVAIGQTQAGGYLIGGMGTFKVNKRNITGQNVVVETKERSIMIDPNFSYFVINNLCMGLALNTTHSNDEDVNYKSRYKHIVVGPSMRYYFPFGKWAVFPVVSYERGWFRRSGNVFSITKGFIIEVEDKGFVNVMSAGIGLTYFLNRHAGVEGILSYDQFNRNYDENKFSDTQESSINVKLGLQVYINRRNVD